ncbi:unnamed protein product [Ixodes pacificus]
MQISWAVVIRKLGDETLVSESFRPKKLDYGTENLTGFLAGNLKSSL